MAGLKSDVALVKESVTAQVVALREDTKMVRKGLLCEILKREEASHRAQQALEVHLKEKFEVKSSEGG